VNSDSQPLKSNTGAVRIDLAAMAGAGEAVGNAVALEHEL
jgi:hypothetical protein